MERATCLQNPRPPDEIDAWIIGRYRALYDAFFEERVSSPTAIHEIRFEDLERTPVARLRELYERLGIPGFEAFQPSLENYVSANSGYRKNEYGKLPASLCKEISKAWRRGFGEWNYPCD